MTAMDEIQWAERHFERLRVTDDLPTGKECIEGFMMHTLRALRELAVAAGVPQEPKED